MRKQKRGVDSVLLPMNRLYDELNKVDHYRQSQKVDMHIVQQNLNWFERAAENLALRYLLAKARSEPMNYMRRSELEN